MYFWNEDNRGKAILIHLIREHDDLSPVIIYIGDVNLNHVGKMMCLPSLFPFYAVRWASLCPVHARWGWGRAPVSWRREVSARDGETLLQGWFVSSHLFIQPFITVDSQIFILLLEFQFIVLIFSQIVVGLVTRKSSRIRFQIPLWNCSLSSSF